jgi:adenylate cyclase
VRAGRRRQRVILIAAVGVLAAVLGLVLQLTGALQRVDDAGVDLRFSIRGEQAPPDELVVVGIDEPSFGALGLQWPLPRSVHADAIRALTRAGARVIVYDVQFSEQTTPFDGSQAAAAAALDEDLALQDAITASKRVVLATTLVYEDGSPGVLFSDERLRKARASVGSANYDVGPTGTFRRVPYAVDGLRHVAVVASERATGERVDPGPFGDDGAWIDYAGPPGTITTVEFSDLLEGKVPAATFRDRVVVVGAAAPRLQDVHATSYGDEPMSGPEITANAISTVMRDVPLRDSPGWLDALLIVGLAGAAALAGLRRSVLLGLAPSLVLLVALVVVVQVAFAGGTVLPVAAPALALVIAALGALAVNYATVERERRRLRTEFARFVPTEVVGDLIEQMGDGSRLGGRRLYSTVMFCDLRGFTARAERLPPEMVIELLNDYLTQMSDAILDNGGTLVSYQGDGIMAVFGAPLEQPDHADRALAAARQMLDARLPRVNARVAERGMGEPFTMGIGLCSGPVMSGNVGSERRLEYAAVGDTTNTAARLQGLTREAGRALLIADTTRAALTRPVPDLVAVGALEVRGRQVPAAVWTLGGTEGKGSPTGG